MLRSYTYLMRNLLCYTSSIHFSYLITYQAQTSSFERDSPFGGSKHGRLATLKSKQTFVLFYPHRGIVSVLPDSRTHSWWGIPDTNGIHCSFSFATQPCPCQVTEYELGSWGSSHPRWAGISVFCGQVI